MKPILASLLTPPASLIAAEHNPAKPNVLLIILEDRGPYLNCYGEQAMDTPNLDQLPSEGRLYKNCFSLAPVCSVGRSTLMVGLTRKDWALGLETAQTAPELLTVLQAVARPPIQNISL